MGRPPNCGCCDCFDDVILDTWIGSRTLNLDLTTYPGWTQQLENDPRALIWAVVVKSTGDVPDGTFLRMQQGEDRGREGANYRPSYSLGSLVAPVDFERVRNESEWDGTGFKWLPLQIGTIHNGFIQRAWGDHLQWVDGADPAFAETFGGHRRSLRATSYETENYDVTIPPTNGGEARFFVRDLQCPMEFELQCRSVGNPFNTLVEQLEYALVVICVTECDDPLDDWWHSFEQFTDPFGNDITTFDARMNDALHIDQEYCRDGVMVAVEAHCQPHVMLTSFVDRTSQFNMVNGVLMFGDPLIRVARLKTIYGVPRCHFLTPLQYTKNDLLQTQAIEFQSDWADLTRVEVLWLSGFGENSDSVLGPPNTANNFAITLGFLSELTAWLNQGNRVLVIDGHYLPFTLLPYLGLTTTVGVERTATYVNAVPHPFTTGVTGSLLSGTNIVRQLTLGAGGTMIGEGVAGATTFPAIVCESWPGNTTSRVIIYMSATDLPSSLRFTPRASKLSEVGPTTFLQNFDTQRLVF